MTLCILHNPRCSKSRATLALLEERGLEPEIRRYLENPPSPEELTEILRMLGMSPRDLIRKGESEYRELGLSDDGIGDEELIRTLCRHPRLMQRPVVIAGGRAAIGRPPEAVLDIL